MNAKNQMELTIELKCTVNLCRALVININIFCSLFQRLWTNQVRYTEVFIEWMVLMTSNFNSQVFGRLNASAKISFLHKIVFFSFFSKNAALFRKCRIFSKMRHFSKSPKNLNISKKLSKLKKKKFRIMFQNFRKFIL